MSFMYPHLPTVHWFWSCKVWTLLNTKSMSSDYYFWVAWLLTKPKMVTVVKNLFRSRAESYFDSNTSSTGVLPKICKALRKYGLFDYFKLWFETSVFPVYSSRKATVTRKVRENETRYDPTFAWNTRIWNKHMTAWITSHLTKVFNKSLPRSCQSAPCSGQDHGEFQSQWRYSLAH